MEKYFKIYKRHSVPLEVLNSASVGEFVYTSTGDCFQCIGDGPEMTFREFHESVLNKDEYIDDMSKDILNLFWILSDKSFNAVVRELQNKIDMYEGDEIEDTSKFGQ